MSTLAPYFRNYELPWSPSAEVEQRFRRVVRNCLIAFAVFVVLMWLLPLPEPSQVKTPALPDAVVKLVLQKKVQPPPKVVEPEKPKEELKKEEPKPQEVKPQPTPQPEQRQEQARQKAAKALAVFDELAALRDNSAAAKAQQTQTLTNAVAETRSERNMITSAAGKGSGGINDAKLSRGYGGSTGDLAGHNTTQVTSNIGAGEAREVQRGSGSNKGKRDASEVAQILDSNKGAIFALYSRALRDNPDLQGKVVLKLVIAPSGEVTSCEVVSSELNDPDLERKLVARIKLIRFPARDVESLIVTHPIEFFPAG